MKLQDGDILICKADRFIPILIKKFTKSEWNHSAIYVESWGMPGVIEAQTDGINWKPWDAWVKEYNYEYIAYRKKTFMDQRENIARKAFSKCGHTGYDFFSFILRHPWQLITGKWKNRGKEEEKTMICSEFVGWVYNMTGWWKMTPDIQKKYMDKATRFNRI
jgi:hypothetical protein